ncbi:unnamed protein product [Cuscuta campestris]|uniref:Retrotransposon Copia-like N-terminal domain-containing protein n=1 Tax=Cuscuta campestris TaxID=132261 RepID=A0A484NAB2_9ASTE|nr:unnamed protein product [Cuscuta campestris]
MNLLGYLDGSITAPKQFLDTACTKLNPEYTAWFRQDQILLGALLGSCSDLVQPLVSLAETSHGVCSRLNSHLASMSRGRIISLKAQLNKNPRGNRSIEKFMKDMTDIATDLALAGSPVSDADFIVSIITQLGEEYHAIYQSLHGSGLTLTIDELTHILTDCERQLQQTNVADESLVPTANFTQRGASQSRATVSSTYSIHNNSAGGSRRGKGMRSGQSQSRGRLPRHCNFCDFSGHDTRFYRKLQLFLRDKL